jgi:hypothetical protein
MGLTIDLGRRIELVPMDSHFHDISVALYSQAHDQGPAYKIHTYSSIDGTDGRIGFLVEAMKTLGSMESIADDLLHFSCWSAHKFAVKRLFLEACKLDPNQPIQAKPPQIFDKKAECDMLVTGLGQGQYQISAATDKKAESRISVITRGLAKLGEMDMKEGIENRAGFACGTPHDPLVSLLLVRAPNVRAAIREAEAAAVRGVLAAPSSQE